MFSDLAIMICLNMVTCELMAECFIWMQRTGTTFVRFFITWMVFAAGSFFLGFNIGQWATLNLGS